MLAALALLVPVAVPEGTPTERTPWATAKEAVAKLPAPAPMVSDVQNDLWVARTLTDFPIPQDDLTAAANAADLVMHLQASRENLPLTPVVEVKHDLPWSAFQALLQRTSAAALPTEDEAALRSLDQLPEPARSALTRFVDAFLAFQAAADRVYGPLPSAAGPGEVLGARAMLLEASVELAKALQTTPPSDLPRVSVVVPFALALDLIGTDSTYTVDVALSLDVGGHDLYLNNAGGGSTLCHLLRQSPAAAMVDLGGNDRYLGNRCGVNGGGMLGAGFAFDAAGEDVYLGGPEGTNGGSYMGLGFLFDAAGNDRYQAGINGVNGGAYGNVLAASMAMPGMLVDASGNDVYQAGGEGTNGAGYRMGQGYLVDFGGDDVYEGGRFASNGGGLELGVGFLVDARGDDSYIAGLFADNIVVRGCHGSNGAGVVGSGFLLDYEGDDVYACLDKSGVPDGIGANGGSSGIAASRGSLFDFGGNDRYVAGSRGVNGGVSEVGLGILLDIGGQDTYVDGDGGSGTDASVVPKGIAGAQLDVP